MGKYRMKNKGSAEQSQSTANNDISFLHIAADWADCAPFRDLFCQTKAYDRL
jgi:uncharacterized protein (DUF488 family)